MRVYVDVVTLIPTAELWDRSTIIQNCTAKRGDGGVLEVMFHRSGVPELLPVGTVVTYIVKTQGKYDQNPGLCELEIVDRPATVEEFYTGEPDYNTATLDDELESGDGDDSNDVPFVLGDGEISWLLPDPGAKPKSSLTFPVTVHNDVKKGNEGPPATGAPGYLTAAQSDARYVHAVDGKVPVEQLPDATESAIGASRRATQAEAEAGVQNTAHMTALRVWQAIAAWWIVAKSQAQSISAKWTFSAPVVISGADGESELRELSSMDSRVTMGFWVKKRLSNAGAFLVKVTNFFDPTTNTEATAKTQLFVDVNGVAVGPNVTSAPTEALEVGGNARVSGNITGSGTNNTLPSQTMSSGPSIATRSTGDGRWAQLATYGEHTAPMGWKQGNKYISIGDFASGRMYYGQYENSTGTMTPLAIANWEGTAFENGKRRTGVQIELGPPSSSSEGYIKLYAASGIWGTGGTPFVAKNFFIGSYSFSGEDIVIVPSESEAMRFTAVDILVSKRLRGRIDIGDDATHYVRLGSQVPGTISEPDITYQGGSGVNARTWHSMNRGNYDVGQFWIWEETGAKIFKFYDSGDLDVPRNLRADGTSNTMPNQTAASGSSVMTRELGDARWGLPILWNPTSDITVNNSATNIQAASLTLPQNSICLIRGIIVINNVNAAAGAKLQFNQYTGPTDESARISGFAHLLTDTTLSAVPIGINDYGIDSASGTTYRLEFSMRVEVSASGAGLLNLYFSQKNATAADTKIIANKSWIEIVSYKK